MFNFFFYLHSNNNNIAYDWNQIQLSYWTVLEFCINECLSEMLCSTFLGTESEQAGVRSCKDSAEEDGPDHRDVHRKRERQTHITTVCIGSTDILNDELLI